MFQSPEGDQATDDDNAQKRKLPGSHGKQPGLQAGTKSAANSDVKKKKETPAADEVLKLPGGKPSLQTGILHFQETGPNIGYRVIFF